MFQVESPYEILLFTTVRIEATLPNGSISQGTGFLFSYVKDKRNYIFLVTNKHIIKDTIVGTLSFNRAESAKPLLGNIFTIDIGNFEKQWVGHPNDEIDVAIMPFAPILNGLDERGVRIYFRSITQSFVPSDESLKESIDAIEDIIFIGYPNNIYDKNNLLPVVRKGITATPISVDFNIIQ